MLDEFSVALDENRTIFLTEISRRTFEEQALLDLDSDGGIFVALEDTAKGTFDILAKVASFSAGEQLIGILTRWGKPALVG